MRECWRRAMTVPQILPFNLVEHFYEGGERIGALRGVQLGPGPLYRPEEWIASMTTMSGATERGLSPLQDRTLLRDAVLADPQGWLGQAHVDSYGTSTELLVKLLDAGQRLPVHAHPDRAFARRHLGMSHGKTEAWVVLDAPPDARVRLGLAESMCTADVRALVESQDSAALVGALRALPVRPGDAVLIPAGLPHCIDAGVFVLELQEPTDLSILLEWDGFAVEGRRDGHLGLGFDVAIQALRLSALEEAELDRLVVPAEETATDAGMVDLLPAAAAPFFRAHRVWSVRSGPTVEAGFAVVLVTEGTGRLVAEFAAALEVTRGEAAVIPWSAGDWRFEGVIEAIVCRPPTPRRAGDVP
jgi:mannose-6-phosphate isomerase